MDEPGVGGFTREERRPLRLELHLPSPGQRVPDLFQAPGFPGCPLSMSPQRSQPRPRSRCEVPRDSETRTVKVGKVPREVREECPPRTSLRPAPKPSAGMDRNRVAAFRGYRPRPSDSRQSPPVRVKGKFFAEFFAGCGVVSKQARAIGFPTREWEFVKGVI